MRRVGEFYRERLILKVFIGCSVSLRFSAKILDVCRKLKCISAMKKKTIFFPTKTFHFSPKLLKCHTFKENITLWSQIRFEVGLC